MSKIKLIRCKTPHDILVIRKREDFNSVIDSLTGAGASKCGHPHLIVCGDLYFRTPEYVKGAKKI